MANFMQKIKGIMNVNDFEEEDEEQENTQKSKIIKEDKQSKEKEQPDEEVDDILEQDEDKSDFNNNIFDDKQEDNFMYSNINSGSKSQSSGIDFSGKKAKVIIECPKKFDRDLEKIADELIQSNTVILNLEGVSQATRKRLIDFFSGVAYAQKGKISAVSTNTYIMTPNNVETEGNVSSESANFDDTDE